MFVPPNCLLNMDLPENSLSLLALNFILFGELVVSTTMLLVAFPLQQQQKQHYNNGELLSLLLLRHSLLSFAITHLPDLCVCRPGSCRFSFYSNATFNLLFLFRFRRVRVQVSENRWKYHVIRTMKTMMMRWHTPTHTSVNGEHFVS